MSRSSVEVDGPKSLETLCVQIVANNLGKVKWHQSFVGDEDDSSYSVNPLNVLPHSLLTSVIKSVKKTRITKSVEGHLDLLITKKLEDLDLISFSEISEDAAFRLLFTAFRLHSPLKMLKFSLPQTSYHHLQSILPAFANLQVLDIQDTKSVKDRFMLLVASSFPRLKSLSVKGCRGVTDVGMERLCTSSESSTGGGICGSLIQLNIRCTGVTKRGARLALEHLTKLEELDWQSVAKLVAKMYRTGERRPLSLRTLRFIGKEKDGALAAVVKLCPLLVHLTIFGRHKPSGQDVRALVELDNLQRLILPGANRISCDEDLLPVLQKFGHKSLEFLYVSNINEVNLEAVIESCSNLGFLSVSLVKRFTQSHRLRAAIKPTSHRYLPSLQHLEIQAKDQDYQGLALSCQPSAADLSLLLASAPALIDLTLGHLDNLTDGIFSKSVAQHGFTKLKRLNVFSCPNLTKSVVADLLPEVNISIYPM